MVTLAPSNPIQASHFRLGDPAPGVGQLSREMQEHVFDLLRRFYDYSRALPYMYNRNQAAVMEQGVTGQETFMLKALGPVGRAWERLLSLRIWTQGWNGHDALAPDPAAVVNAIKWIPQLYSVALASQYPWLEPNITASADGEVVFEWWHQHRKLTVYVSGDGAMCVRVWGSNIDTEMAEGDISATSDQQASWLWLLAEPEQ